MQAFDVGKILRGLCLWINIRGYQYKCKTYEYKPLSRIIFFDHANLIGYVRKCEQFAI